MRNALKKNLRESKKDHFERVCKDSSKQPKRAWEELNKALGCKVKSHISQLETNSSTLTSPFEIENQLNSYFTNSANCPAHCCDLPSLRQVEPVFHFQHLGEDEVLTALKQLNVHKATGVDGVSAHLLCMVAETIAPSIVKLYNQSQASGEVPTEWKHAGECDTSPRCTAAGQPSDFRPISVLRHCQGF